VIKGYDYGADQALAGRVKDDGLSFFRPMHIVADRLAHGLGGCERSATLERNRRLARAHRIDLDVAGWEYIDAAGARQPWRINEQVRVVIDNGDDQVDGVFLVGDVRMLQSGSGTRTVLTVMHRNAFAGEQAKKRTKRAAGVR
jgi:prophage tail gpP-like protein